MERAEFEMLRNLPGKTINQNILLKAQKGKNKYELEDRVQIANSLNVDAELVIRFNHATDKKTINVFLPGTGPICRLDIDAPEHPPCGRHHKHSLVSARCPNENLSQNVIDRSELSGKTIEEVIIVFCQQANIVHTGTFTIDPQYV